MNYQSIIDHYYKEDDALKHILLVHSRQVADRALLIARKHPELQLDTEFLEAAAMLHDIGIIRCDAPGIECYGTEPYICHGRLGAEMLRSLSQSQATNTHHPTPTTHHPSPTTQHPSLTTPIIESLARVCERHTGAGLSLRDIEAQNLPLPHQDFLPETMAEQVICYADKFYSKSHLEREKTVEEAARSLAKFGNEGVERFRKWAQMFE